MDDLIRRKALLEDIEETVIFTVQKDVPSAEMRGANKVIDRIKAASTIDPESLRPQGEWEFDSGVDYCYKCSECEAQRPPHYIYDNYCPNCGAKMKGADGK